MNTCRFCHKRVPRGRARCRRHEPPRMPLEQWLARFWAEPLPESTVEQLARRDTPHLLDQLVAKRGPAYARAVKPWKDSNEHH